MYPVRNRHLLPYTLAVILSLGATALPALAAPSAGTPLQQAIQRGAELFKTDTFGGEQRYYPAGSFDGHPMTCEACHRDGGRVPSVTTGGRPVQSLIQAAAHSPRYDARLHKVITLEDQVQVCVRDGLLATPPAYGSQTMTDLVSYIVHLAKGQRIGG